MRTLFLLIVLFPIAVYYFAGFTWMLAALALMFLCAALVLFVSALGVYAITKIEGFDQ